MTEFVSEARLRSLGPLGPWLPSTETPQTTERRRLSAPTILHRGEMDERDQNAQATTLQCPFTDCDVVTTNASEVVAVALFNAHIATHTMASANEEA